MDTGLRNTPALALPSGALDVLGALEGAGYEAWVVGGFVRDALLGRESHDVDIATNARWEQVRGASVAAGFACFETGVAHGTVTVHANGQAVEVTTYRTESSYSDARHPDSVSFVDAIEQDLARRDFTMNAIAYHPDRGLYDPFEGALDLGRRVVRAVGAPEERFAEDALRIVRAVRFASELGFDVEPTTRAGADANVGRLGMVAVERIAVELTRLLCGAGVRKALLSYPAVIDAVLPELAPMRGFDQRSPYHVYDVYEHTAHVVEGCPPDARLRWAALLHDCGKPDSFTVDETGQGHFYGHAKRSALLAEGILARLRMPARFSRDVVLLVANHDTHRKASHKAVKRMLRELDESPELLRDLCSLNRADALAHAPRFQERALLADQMEACLDEVLAAQEAFSLRDLTVRGEDVIALGVHPGPEVGRLLSAALDAVVDDEVANDRDALLSFLERRVKDVSAL